MPKDEFDRISSGTAIQVIRQKLREAERDNIVNEFEDKQNAMQTCIIRKIENKNVVNSFKFENYNGEKDYIYTVKIKQNGRQNLSLYQLVDGNLIEIAIDEDGDNFVFRTNNLKGEFFFAKDKPDGKVVVSFVILGAIVSLVGVAITLRIIRIRKAKKSEISDVVVDNYNIG